MCSSPINNGGNPHIHHLGSSSTNIPDNIRQDIQDVQTKSDAMVQTLKDIAAGKYPDPEKAHDAWDNVMVPLSGSEETLGSDIDKMPKGPTQDKLKSLQGAFNEICMDMDQGMFGGNYSKATAQYNLNFWTTGSSPLPSGPSILQDLKNIS